jgi:hypothetical protein
MKKIYAYLALALAVLVTGCMNPIMPKPASQENSREAAGDGAGSALISFGGGARTLLPYAADFYYVLDFTPGQETDGQAFTKYVNKSSSASVELAAGQWSLEVKGYIDAEHATETPEEPGLTGSADNFTVTSGQQVFVPVTLTAYQSYEGEGEFGYTISFPSGVISAELSLVNILQSGVGDQGPIDLLDGASESGGVKTANGLVTGVPAGFFRMVLDLSTSIENVPARALKTRVVRINDSLLTKTEEVFGSDDFFRGRLFDTLADLKAYLDELPVNAPESPYAVGLSIDLSSTIALKNESGDNLGVLYEALTRYVELDLSACTGTITGATGSGSTTGRTNAPNLVTVTLPPPCYRRALL